MIGSRIALLSIALITASACNPFRQQSTVEVSETGAIAASRWNATLATPAELSGVVQVTGTGWMAPDSGRTVASVAISNAPPGGVHPWHVHQGRCGSKGPIYGPTDAYAPLVVEGNGTGRAQASLGIPLPSSGSYYVDVHASSNNVATIIACGNLAPPSR